MPGSRRKPRPGRRLRYQVAILPASRREEAVPYASRNASPWICHVGSDVFRRFSSRPDRTTARRTGRLACMANDARIDTPAGSAGDSAVDYRSLLEREREELLGKLAELGFGEGGGLTYDANFADSSQVTAERGEAEALAGELREALTEVDRALGKLDAGHYGICDACGQPINPARLEAMPATRYCIDCAGKAKR